MLKNWGRLTLQGFDQSDIHNLNIDLGGGNDDSWPKPVMTDLVAF